MPRPAHPPPDELRAWLVLCTTGAVSRPQARALLARFGGPAEVLAAGPAGWAAEVGAPQCAALRAAASQGDRLLERTWRWLEDQAQRVVITLGDPRYPAALVHSPDPPLVLHVEGDDRILDRPVVAIVGSRHASRLGMNSAREFAQELSHAGCAIASGLAMGIDAAAHEGALQGDGGTIAVLGCGVDVVYPKRNRDLHERVRDRGILVSEYSLGTPAIQHHFPQRNRVIAGLSRVVVVVEAAMRSGSLITARLAAEAGREVLAVPGPLNSPLSSGCHWLIKQGAGLMEGAADVWACAPWAFHGCRMTPEPQAQRLAYGKAHAMEPFAHAAGSGYEDLRRHLQGGPAGLDELVRAGSLGASQWQERLMMAELEGLIGRLPGGLYQWMAPGR